MSNQKNNRFNLHGIRAACRRVSIALKRNFVVAALVAFVSIGVMGAGLKYLETQAELSAASRNQAPADPGVNSIVSRINPFLPALPTPAPPSLSKEYVYAGSRMLAVEDTSPSSSPMADLAVFRPSTGVWWVLGGPNSQQFAATWGSNGDVPITGDFDGDAKTDLAFFRPTGALWQIMRSSNSTSYAQQFGLASDIPAAADFDGDGRTDIAVFRPSDRTWYVLRSSDSTIQYCTFGLSGDVPVPADYDGDGKANFAIWRPSDQTFWFLSNQNQGFASQFAVATYPSATPVPADYDGDGKTDFAIRTGSSWVVRRTSDGRTTTTNWQVGTDKAVQNDFDGDGKADVAVWRPSNGTWYILQSSNGATRQQQWGLSGDIPVPAYYRR